MGRHAETPSTMATATQMFSSTCISCVSTHDTPATRWAIHLKSKCAAKYETVIWGRVQLIVQQTDNTPLCVRWDWSPFLNVCREVATKDKVKLKTGKQPGKPRKAEGSGRGTKAYTYSLHSQHTRSRKANLLTTTVLWGLNHRLLSYCVSSNIYVVVAY